MAHQPEPAAARATRAVTLVPAIVALAVGVLYALGAILTTAQLRGADLDPRDAVPLVPVEQLLARGIGVAADKFLTFMFIAGVVGGLVWTIAWLERRGFSSRERAERRAGSSQSRWPRRLVWTGAGAVYLLILVTEPVFDALALLSPAIGGFLIADALSEHRPVRNVILNFAALYGLLIAINLIEEFVHERPLSDVTIIRNDAAPVQGGLIAATGAQWFVAVGDGTFLSIPTSEIRRASVVRGKERRKPRSLACVAIGRFCET